MKLLAGDSPENKKQIGSSYFLSYLMDNFVTFCGKSDVKFCA